ncbi:MAG: hypothetical protein HYV63_19915 [Candidatus Schekmanbacteria bacterium]|nr:hypothetical protein [Candidatus Schekmanbacteria bacterium]
MHGASDSGQNTERKAQRDAYRGVVLVFLVAALLGAAGAAAAGAALVNPVLLDAAVTLGLASVTLLGVIETQAARARARVPAQPAAVAPGAVPAATRRRALLAVARAWVWRLAKPCWAHFGRVCAGASLLATLRILLLSPGAAPPSPPASGIVALAAGLALAAAAVAGTVARYLAAVEPARFPEAPGLCRSARVTAWVLVGCALAVASAWASLPTAVLVTHAAAVLLNLAISYGMLTAPMPAPGGARVYPTDLTVFAMFGSRANALGSALDAARSLLGIDLRSTWALAVVRTGFEPLLAALGLIAWLSTAVTIVGVGEQALIERLGIPAGGPALGPGLHTHAPWPIDRVIRVPVRRVQTLAVGHPEAAAESGPEDVLWAKEHAADEYTLLLGDGRDLVTIDATVQFRIADAAAWTYRCRNPVEALRAVAYRAVMKVTVSRTLTAVLSENVATLTAAMRASVQADADALGLGVEIVAFTVGGMHPPVMVAADYQAVVSAELGKATAAINAEAYRKETVPAAEAAATAVVNAARGEAAGAKAQAAGQAWAFRTLEAEYRAAPGEYLFRRRLEALESVLPGRRFTLVDARIERDGGELWLMP